MQKDIEIAPKYPMKNNAIDTVSTNNASLGFLLVRTSNVPNETLWNKYESQV